METPYKYTCAPKKIKLATLERDNYTCQECGRVGKSGKGGYSLHVHHKMPVRLGGTHTLDNLVTVCASCHKKLDRAYWVETIREFQIRFGFKNLTER
jgi:5-methylcytosine-specific restriction endonuclease McrA